MFTIRLEDLHFFSRIGVMEQERVVGNEFRVDIAFDLPSDDFVDEDLSTTISYADVYDYVSECMNTECLLLETVAKRIGEGLLNKYERIFNIRVKICKLSVPVVNMTGCASVEYFSQKKLL
jgi:dihydroneopterin aldolase